MKRKATRTSKNTKGIKTRPRKKRKLATRSRTSKAAAKEAIPTDKPKDLPTCAICLGEVKLQGKLNTCEHEFCFSCIDKWSKVENSCPLCKRRFNKITKKQLWGAPLKAREKKNFNVRTKNQSQDVFPDDWGELAVVFSDNEDWEGGEYLTDDHMWRLFRVLTQNTGTLLNHLRRQWRINIQVSPNPVQIDLTGDSDDELDLEGECVSTPATEMGTLPSFVPPSFEMGLAPMQMSSSVPTFQPVLPSSQRTFTNNNFCPAGRVVYDLTGDDIEVVRTVSPSTTNTQPRGSHVASRHRIPPPPNAIRLPPIIGPVYNHLPTHQPLRRIAPTSRQTSAVVDLVDNDFVGE